MNVFEDLINELKNENLLEDAVVDRNRSGHVTDTVSPAASAQDCHPSGLAPERGAERGGEGFVGLPSIDRDFFHERAKSEVSGLQMVEHVLSGVERKHMKTNPSFYDDLNARKALHRFMQSTDDAKLPEYARSDLALRQEIEAWSFALYERDRKVSVANIRRFCEESRPALSSQALIALARFYRNLPYSEDVRAKFDYVMTRLFSRDAGGETRTFLFAREETAGHIATLYANWTSVALYTRENDRADISRTVTRFDQFTSEVEEAGSFDELLGSDFFNRVRLYKEQVAEMFFVPEVVASAIRCNLAIGNRYVELIRRELPHQRPFQLEEKYGDSLDQIVSHAACKNLSVEGVMFDAGTVEPTETRQRSTPARPVEYAKSKRGDEKTIDLFGANKWLMILCLVLVVISGAAYIWSEKFAGGNGGDATLATPVEVDDAEVKKYLHSARASDETIYAVTQPAFDTLSLDEKKGILARLLQFARAKNLTKVNLLDRQGKTVAHLSGARLELIEN